MNIKCTLLVAAFSTFGLTVISADASAGVNVGVSIGYPGAYGVVGPQFDLIEKFRFSCRNFFRRVRLP